MREFEKYEKEKKKIAKWLPEAQHSFIDDLMKLPNDLLVLFRRANYRSPWRKADAERLVYNKHILPSSPEYRYAIEMEILRSSQNECKSALDVLEARCKFGTMRKLAQLVEELREELKFQQSCAVAFLTSYYTVKEGIWKR